MRFETEDILPIRNPEPETETEAEPRHRSFSDWLELAVVLFLSLFMGFLAGYYVRDAKTPSPVRDAQSLYRAYEQAATRTIHGAEKMLGRGLTDEENATYVWLVQRLAHPCPMDDRGLELFTNAIMNLTMMSLHEKQISQMKKGGQDTLRIGVK